MIDFGTMETALKISWIPRIQENSDAAWKAIPEYLLSHLGGLAFAYRSDIFDDSAQTHNEIIWNNSKIVIDKKNNFLQTLFPKWNLRPAEPA